MYDDEEEKEELLVETPLDEEVPEFLQVVDEEDDDSEPEPKPKKAKDDGRFQRRIDEMRHAQGQAERALVTEQHKSSELQQRIEKLESGVHTKEEEDLRGNYANVRAMLRQAVEEGDTDKQVELTESLSDLRTRAHMIDFKKEAEVEVEPETVPPTQPAPSPPKEAMIWWNNRRWFNAPQFEEESKEARKIDVELIAEGYDKEDPNFYEELDNRLQEQFPRLYKGSAKRSKPPTTPSKGGGGMEQRPQMNDGRIVMTASELATAKDLGMTTKEEFAAFAKELAKSRKGNSNAA